MDSQTVKSRNGAFQHLLLFASAKAAKTAGDIYAMYGEGVVMTRTSQTWFARSAVHSLRGSAHLLNSMRINGAISSTKIPEPINPGAGSTDRMFS